MAFKDWMSRKGGKDKPPADSGLDGLEQLLPDADEPGAGGTPIDLDEDMNKFASNPSRASGRGAGMGQPTPHEDEDDRDSGNVFLQEEGQGAQEEPLDPNDEARFQLPSAADVQGEGAPKLSQAPKAKRTVNKAIGWTALVLVVAIGLAIIVVPFLQSNVEQKPPAQVRAEKDVDRANKAADQGATAPLKSWLTEEPAQPLAKQVSERIARGDGVEQDTTAEAGTPAGSQRPGNVAKGVPDLTGRSIGQGSTQGTATSANGEPPQYVPSKAELARGDFSRDPKYPLDRREVLEKGGMAGFTVLGASSSHARGAVRQATGVGAEAAAVPVAQSAPAAPAARAGGQGQGLLGALAVKQGEQYLGTRQLPMLSPYTLKTMSYIPVVLESAINTDLPKYCRVRVTRNIYDSVTGTHLLIPRDTRISCEYDSALSYGATRVLMAYTRMDFPDGSYMPLHGQPGVDVLGAAGITGDVDNHWMRTFSSAVLVSVVGGGIAEVINRTGGTGGSGNQTMGQTIAQQFATTFGQVSLEVINRGLNIKPTIKVKPGEEMNVLITGDLMFEGPYKPMR